MLDQRREHIESSAADLDWDAVFLENSLSWAQPKGSELDYAVKRRPSCGCLGTGFAQFPVRLRIRGCFMRVLLRLLKRHVRIPQLHARRLKSRGIVRDARKV
jgi:hypothetical protein